MWVVTGRDLVGVRDSGLVVSLEGVKLEAAVGITLLSSGGKEDRGECKKKGVGVGWGGVGWGIEMGIQYWDSGAQWSNIVRKSCGDRHMGDPKRIQIVSP